MSVADETDVVQGEPVTEPASTDNINQVVTPAEPVVEQPPYIEYLEKFPESLRPMAEETFKELDAKVNKRFETLHSEQEPWKDITSDFDPETVKQAIGLAQALENDPKAVYDALVQAYNFGQGQTEPQQTPNSSQTVTPPAGSGEGEEDDPVTKKLTELEKQNQLLAQAFVASQDQEKMAAANQQLDGLLATLKGKHGDFDETYVLTQLANGVDPDKAVEQFKTIVGQYAAQQNTPTTTAPTVVGGGSGTPAETVDVSKLSPKETKNHVANLLAAAAAEAAG